MAGQGDDEDDRVEPTEKERAQNKRLMDDVASGKRKLLTLEAGRDFGPRYIGPQSDQDFEPRRRKSAPLYASGGKVLNTKSWRK